MRKLDERRILPHDLELEASILGGVFLQPPVMATLPDLEPDDFWDHKHKLVFQAMRNLEARSTAIDLATVEFELNRLDKLEAVGGPGFLGELTLKCPTADNVRTYAAIVMRLHQHRRMAVAASEIVDSVYSMGWDPDDEYLAFAERTVMEISRRGSRGAPPTVAKIVKDRIKQIYRIAEQREQGGTEITGVPTGIAKLDEYLGGYPRKVPVLVAGRPKMGKSSVAIAATCAATAAGIGAMVFSLEDGCEAYADSLLARGSGVSTEKLRAAKLDRGDMHPLSLAIGDLVKRENWRFEERVLDAPSICRELRRAKAEIPNFGLGVVDYVQLVKRAPRMNEHEAIADHMRHFAAAAKELDIALLVISQLNRDLEKRDDKRPTMPDLRGSGSLEETAKLILFAYRGSYYYGTPKKEIDYDCDHQTGATWCQCRPSDREFDETIQLIVAANNQGRTGRVFARWEGHAKRVS